MRPPPEGREKRFCSHSRAETDPEGVPASLHSTGWNTGLYFLPKTGRTRSKGLQFHDGKAGSPAPGIPSPGGTNGEEATGEGEKSVPRAPAVRGHPLPLSEGSGEGILIIESQKAAYLAQAESRILQILPRKKSPFPGDNFMECGAGRAQHALEGRPIPISAATSSRLGRPPERWRSTIQPTWERKASLLPFAQLLRVRSSKSSLL